MSGWDAAHVYDLLTLCSMPCLVGSCWQVSAYTSGLGTCRRTVCFRLSHTAAAQLAARLCWQPYDEYSVMCTREARSARISQAYCCLIHPHWAALKAVATQSCWLSRLCISDAFARCMSLQDILLRCDIQCCSMYIHLVAYRQTG
jgi:hypothetical protein